MECEEDVTCQASGTWDLVKPCFSRDIGTQRCRLPARLMSLLGASTAGTPLLIDFSSHSLLCLLTVWKGQAGSCFQADDTVTVPPAGEGTFCETAIALTASSFQLLRLDIPKRVKIDLVLEDFGAIEDFRKHQARLIPLLVEVLSAFALMPGCTIDGQHSEPCRLLKIRSIFVQECPLKPLSAGRVTSKTTVEIGAVMSQARYEALAAARTVRAPFGGLDKPRKLLVDLVTFPCEGLEAMDGLGVSCPKGVLLIGPPGTGKTSLVGAVARDCGACLVHVAGPSLCRPEPGESEAALRGVFRTALELSKEGPCILFLDEVDSFLGKKGEKAGGQSERLLAQMLTLMDGLQPRGKMVVVGATNRPNVLDPAIRRPGRFGHEVYIGVPTKSERVEILKVLTAKFPLKNVDLENVADWTPGYVGADLALLCQEIGISKIYSQSKSDGMAVTEDDFQRVLMLMRPSTQRTSFTVSNYEPVAWDDIGGLHPVKLQLKQSLEWPILHADVFHRLGVSRPKGVLLYGPPGCCKTTLVRAAATACNASFLSATAAQLYSPYVGDSEKAIAEIFHRGRLAAPTILFLDEIDSIVGKRSNSSQHGIHEKVLSALLNEMDGIGLQFDSKQGSFIRGEQLREPENAGKDDPSSHPGEKGDVFVVAATNRPDLLDEALMRPGRFDRIIYVPPPDQDMRKQILEVVTRKMPVSHLDLGILAVRTNRFSGADLENLCKEAALCALTKDGLDAVSIHQEHFLSVLETMEPSLTDQQLDFFTRLQHQYQKCLG